MRISRTVIFFIGAVGLLFPGSHGLLALNVNVYIQETHQGKEERTAFEMLRSEAASRIPGPDTLMLLFGGLTGFLLRFTRRSFEEIKRLLDVGVAIMGLAVSLPVLLYAMFMIKIDSPGPVIYRQRRVGKDGREFEIYKLRTMRCGAEDMTGPVWARENDPRITQVGRMLRRMRIDEIPQLYNVLRGEMSIIGPRPERPEIVTKLRDFIRNYDDRLRVKPGITGLAQVLYKYDETLEDVKNKIRFDQLYMENMCLAADLRILARTFLVVATGRGAR